MVLFYTSCRKGVSASKMHLVGHSLGAHLMVRSCPCVKWDFFQGRAGREFAYPSGPFLGRITGLDPAGPRWVAGAREALPDLAEVRRLSAFLLLFLPRTSCPSILPRLWMSFTQMEMKPLLPRHFRYERNQEYPHIIL